MRRQGKGEGGLQVGPGASAGGAGPRGSEGVAKQRVRAGIAGGGTREEGDDQWGHSVSGTQRRGRGRVRALGCCASLAGPGGERLAGPSVGAGGNGPCTGEAHAGKEEGGNAGLTGPAWSLGLGFQVGVGLLD